MVNNQSSHHNNSYSFGILNHIQEINRESRKVYKTYSEEETAWRETIKEGDYIEAILKIDVVKKGHK